MSGEVETAIQAPREGWLSELVAFARREPGKCLAILLVLHVLVWTVLPALVSGNLQLDLAEDLALGREWQLGYWKHPPLPWWLSDIAWRMFGDARAVYLLGPLAAAACMYVVWLLGREVVGGFQALIAGAALEGIHYYNFSVVKFAHDQMQLPFWALTGLFFHRALTRQRMLDWLLAGAALALCFWSKYAAFALAAPLGLFLLIDARARRALLTPGPWLMALAFLVVLAPHLWWLVDANFLPFRYVEGRARVAEHWHQFITFPLRWSASQLFFLLPAIGLFALSYVGGPRTTFAAEDEKFAYDRRVVTMLALGPFAMVTLVSLLGGRLPIAMWGYPLWSFAPLAALMWLGPVTDPAKLKRFAAGVVALLVAIPAIYAAVEAGEPLLRDRPKATQFPGRLLADTITKDWRAKYNAPLAYVGGGEFATNNVAVYSSDHPRVIVHGEFAKSPWIDPADVARKGAVLVWEDGQADEKRIAEWRARFPGFTLRPVLTLPRSTLRPTRPVHINVAIVPPRP